MQLETGKTFSQRAVDENIRRLYSEGDFARRQETREFNPVGHAELASLFLELLGEIAVSDEEPNAVFELLRKLPGRVDNVFVSLEHEEPGDGDKHNCVFVDSVLSAEIIPSLLRNRLQEIVFVDSRIGRDVPLGRADADSGCLRGHRIGDTISYRDSAWFVWRN